MAQRIPEAELALFPNAGHVYFDELPEESAKAVTEFLLRRALAR
jgi:pimeloyl-ACP methyl ester carboxylesterase